MRRRCWSQASLFAVALAVGCGSVSSAPDGGGGAGGSSGGGTGGSSGGAGGAAGAGGATCVLAAGYTFSDGGGLAPMHDTATLEPPNSFHYERMFFGTADAGRLSCDPAMPACGDPTLIDVGDVEAAMADHDVQTTLVLTTRKFYGDRAVADGPDFNFNRADGAGFDMGLPCNTPSTTCTPIPPGISALVDLLRALIRQERMDPACSALAN